MSRQIVIQVSMESYTVPDLKGNISAITYINLSYTFFIFMWKQINIQASIESFTVLDLKGNISTITKQACRDVELSLLTLSSLVYIYNNMYKSITYFSIFV